MGYMRFRQQVEPQLVTNVPPEEETILMDYNDVIYHRRRLQAQEMGRLIGLAWRGLANRLEVLKRLRHKQRTMSIVSQMDNHLLKDIGISR